MIVSYEDSILSYVASIRSYFGLSSSYPENIKFSEIINNAKPERIVLMLVDAMGANLINNKLPVDSFLRKHMLFKTTTVFPSATTAATTSIRNGKAPNENAWLGWTQYLKEEDDIIIGFRSRGFYNDKDYKKGIMWDAVPVEYIETELNKKNIKNKVIFPSFMENGCLDFNQVCDEILKASKDDDCKFIYAYWDKYDSYMHEHGPNSKICDSYLHYINYEIENLSNNLDDKTMLIVLADHGQVDVLKEYNLCGSKYDKYFVRRPALEPRCSAFYIKDNKREEFAKEFIHEFEDEFILLSHKQVLDTHLFGDKDNHQRFEEFIGDYLAIAKAHAVLAYKEKPVKTLSGQHGGMLDDEMIVPVIVYKKGN